MRNVSRKNFLLASLGLAAVASFFNMKRMKPPEKKSTMKYLTQEGKLVQVDLDKMPVAKRNASKEDVRTWIKK